MIPAVAQTLAKVLAGETSLIGTEEIGFNHPRCDCQPGPRLNLYCYDLRTNSRWKTDTLTAWCDVSFLVSVWDNTALGEQRLLSEVLRSLLQHPLLEEELLAPALRGHGSLPMQVFSFHLLDTAALWRALGVPLRPALWVTVTTPVNLQSQPVPANSKQVRSTTGYKDENGDFSWQSTRDRHTHPEPSLPMDLTLSDKLSNWEKDLWQD